MIQDDPIVVVDDSGPVPNSAGSPSERNREPAIGAVPTRRYAGTDRQVRGRLLDVLRANDSPVTRAELDVAWLTDVEQRDRALDSLLADGLVTQTVDGRFALPGEE